MSYFRNPLLLWRTWSVEEGFLFAPLWKNKKWSTKVDAAHCICGCNAPNKNCACGFYGYYQPKNALLPDSAIRNRLVKAELKEMSQIAKTLKKDLFEVYLWKQRQKMRINGDKGLLVDGVIMVWGKIELHNDGARAQFAKPLAIVNDGLNSDVSKLLRKNYALRTFETTSETWLKTAEFGWQMDKKEEWIKPALHINQQK